jgi:amino acid transporter
MGSRTLGFWGAVAIALGGMIGGGIYAVLGVVAGIVGTATWLAFTLAGVVAGCAGYSYARLNAVASEHGGAVTFVQSFVGNQTLAGMLGWTLLVGYVGSMAMYAVAFGEFALWFDAVPEHAAGMPTRPLISLLAVGAFVAVNALGTRSTGVAEAALVGAKVGILLAFGVLGVAYATLSAPGVSLSLGVVDLKAFGPLSAAAVSFVAFQGWQLLFYDQDRIGDPVATIRRSILLSIPVAVAIYALVGVVTTTLVPAAIESTPHTALVAAAEMMTSPWGLGGVGAVVVAASALFSTGSAINATLFSSAHFAAGMVDADLLPDRIAANEHDGIPERSLFVVGAVTAAFAAVGSLGAVTSFASLAFILSFGGVCALAVRERDRDAIHAGPPVVGAIGAVLFFALLARHLYSAERETFWLVLAIAAVVVLVELLYFERTVIEAEIAAAADGLATEMEAAVKGVESHVSLDHDHDSTGDSGDSSTEDDDGDELSGDDGDDVSTGDDDGDELSGDDGDDVSTGDDDGDELSGDDGDDVSTGDDDGDGAGDDEPSPEGADSNPSS